MLLPGIPYAEEGLLTAINQARETYSNDNRGLTLEEFIEKSKTINNHLVLEVNLGSTQRSEGTTFFYLYPYYSSNFL